MYLFVLFYVFIVQSKQCEVWDFDDIKIPALYGAVPREYRNFIIERRDPIWSDRRVGLINTSISGIGIFSSAATSKPNAMVTSSDTITIYHREGLSFDVIELYIMALLRPLDIRISWITGHMDVYLPLHVMTRVEINQFDIKGLMIGCVVEDLDSCGHMMYDDLKICV